MILATLTDLREIKLPWVGDVTLSFVPVLASLIVLGLWPAMAVAAVSGITAAWVTHDPLKIAFNIGNYVISTYLAGLVYLAWAPPDGAFMTKVLPTFGATVVDFVAHTVAPRGRHRPVHAGGGAVKVWRQNYQWALPGYLAGSTLALLLAALYLWAGMPGMLLGIPPLYLIYYSYDIYVKRAQGEGLVRRRARQLPPGTRRLRGAARRAAGRPAQGGGRDRARPAHPDGPPPHGIPEVEGLTLDQRIGSAARWAATTTTTSPSATAAWASSAATSWARGSPRRSSWRWRGACCTTPSPRASGRPRSWRINDGLTRDLEGQRLPYFLTLALAVYDPRPAACHRRRPPQPRARRDGTTITKYPSRGAALGVRAGLEFPEDKLTLGPGTTVPLYTDGLTEARDPAGTLFGMERLVSSLERCQTGGIRDTLEGVWDDIVAFRGESSRPTTQRSCWRASPEAAERQRRPTG